MFVGVIERETLFLTSKNKISQGGAAHRAEGVTYLQARLVFTSVLVLPIFEMLLCCISNVVNSRCQISFIHGHGYWTGLNRGFGSRQGGSSDFRLFVAFLESTGPPWCNSGRNWEAWEGLKFDTASRHGLGVTEAGKFIFHI